MKSFRKVQHLALASALTLILAACGSGAGTQDAAANQAAPETGMADNTATPAPEGNDADAGSSSGDVAAPAPASAPVEPPAAAPAKTAKASASIPVRGQNSIESRCLDRVGRETGARVIGTNRIAESKTSVDIFVNIEGAQAPWRCRGYRDGSIEGIMYTGDEGAL